MVLSFCVRNKKVVFPKWGNHRYFKFLLRAHLHFLVFQRRFFSLVDLPSHFFWIILSGKESLLPPWNLL